MGSDFVKSSIRAIRYAEEMVYPDGWTFVAHTHDCYHAFCVLENTLDLEICGKTYRCEEGSALIVPPLTVHEMKRQDNNNQRVIEIMFEPEEDALFTELRELGYQVKLDSISIHCLRQVAVFANSRETRMRRRAYRYLDAALTQICTAAEELDPYVLNAQFVDMTGLSDVTKAVIIYIDRHYSEQFTLDDMGEELGYNKSYLCTVFKRDTESTINDYLNLVRITHFAEYYSYQSEDISKICSHCGFTSASHFNRTFKKFLGTSPRSYKQIRFPHFNTDTLTSDMKSREDSFHKLRGILERTCAPAARLDVALFSENETEES